MHYARIASDYVAWLRSGESLVTLAGRRNQSVSALRASLNRARDKELLTPTRRGRAGGELTDKARELLKHAGESLEAADDGEP